MDNTNTVQIVGERDRARKRERERLPGDIGTFLPQNSTVSFKKELGRQ